MPFTQQHVEFITVTCLEWKPILEDDKVKDIVTNSLSFMVRDERIRVYAFVIMSNHMHMIWQMLGDHQRADVQRDFLKFTSQKIIDRLDRRYSPLLGELLVNASDRKCQVWERNSLGVPIWSDGVLWQKLGYIHDNPVRAGLCSRSTDYAYSSAGFYFNNDRRWTFLTHVNG